MAALVLLVLGKALVAPEAPLVYICSFWDKPLQYTQNRKLFEAEEQDLFKDIASLPNDDALRKLDYLAKRTLNKPRCTPTLLAHFEKRCPSCLAKTQKKS